LQNDTPNYVTLIEPPDADPHVRWCERERLAAAPYSIFKCRGKILRVGNRKSHLFPCYRMGKSKVLSVQGRTRNEICLRGTIESITQQGETKRKRMDANLVCAPGKRTSFKQRVANTPIQNTEGSFGWLPFTVINNSAMAVTHIDAQRMTGSVFLPFWRPDNQCMVHLTGLMVFEQHAKSPVYPSTAGKYHQAAGDFIQAVDEPDMTIV
jgi:hypothetical protein